IILKAPRKISTEEVPTLFRLSRLQLGILLLRSVIGLILIEIIINQFSRTPILPLTVLLAVPIILFAFRKRIAKFYSRFESRFLGNLNAKELEEVKSMARM